MLAESGRCPRDEGESRSKLPLQRSETRWVCIELFMAASPTEKGIRKSSPDERQFPMRLTPELFSAFLGGFIQRERCVQHFRAHLLPNVFQQP